MIDARGNEVRPDGFMTRSATCPCAWCTGAERTDDRKLQSKRRAQAGGKVLEMSAEAWHARFGKGRR